MMHLKFYIPQNTIYLYKYLELAFMILTASMGKITVPMAEMIQTI